MLIHQGGRSLQKAPELIVAHRDRTLPRIQNMSQNPKLLPSQKTKNTPKNPKCFPDSKTPLDSGKGFWSLGCALDSGTCLWILVSILDSGECF